MSAVGQEKVSPSTTTRRPHTFRSPQLERLIAEKGIPPKTYGLFFMHDEGKALPGNRSGHRIESTSGFLVTANDDHFSFWRDVDPKTGRVGLTRWDRVQPEPDWIGNEDYLGALYTAKKPHKPSRQT